MEAMFFCAMKISPKLFWIKKIKVHLLLIRKNNNKRSASLCDSCIYNLNELFDLKLLLYRNWFSFLEWLRPHHLQTNLLHLTRVPSNLIININLLQSLLLKYFIVNMDKENGWRIMEKAILLIFQMKRFRSSENILILWMKNKMDLWELNS